ncbi:C40 family peptidase [uncultured Friedmanniella sp.]|uniref:C40 family peptidase n=1 Tax=uncultured Friedmanniella sp. TaxID=335381 RepID=UPI0035CB9A8D
MGRIRTGAAAVLTGLALIVPATATETASAAPTSTTPASTTSACHSSFKHYKTIRKGTKGAQARAMECLLREAGRSTTVNGSFSLHDAHQLAAYRSSVGLHAKKVGGRRAWSALLSRGTTPALHRGDKGADVLRLQRTLQSLGWTKVDLDSRYDAKTVTVVKAAQKQRHLSRSGKATAALWKALQHGKVAGPAAHSSGKGATALAFAKKQLGDSYRFGGSGPNAWDCSGLTKAAWKKAGVSLPHSAAAQYHRGKHVSKSNLKPGDLVFFYSGPSHVAIYAGHGKVIHAPHAGAKVSYIKMKYMPYKGARRP